MNAENVGASSLLSHGQADQRTVGGGSLSRSIAQKAVDVLNEAFKADPETIKALVDARIKSNIDPDADSPAVYMQRENGDLVLGMLGVVNGIVECQSGHRICALFEDNQVSKLIGFGILDDVLKERPAERVKVLP